MPNANAIVKTRRLNGTVVSEKNEKTVVVRVSRTLIHPKYGKRYSVSKKYHAHDPNNTAHVGDTVTIEATRPISKLKRWKVIPIV